MKIVVSGLWHLGCVSAACLAEHYDIVGHDPDRDVVAALERGVPPIFEPGLADLLHAGVDAGRLSYTTDAGAAANADVVWIAYDTPVDERDVADVAFVADNVEALLRHARAGALVVIASQVPVGFLARMERCAVELGAGVTFASCPENLRLGNALAIYRHPERIVAGVRSERDRERLAAILAPFTSNVVWMSPESAEMTKHALNGFLATSVTFINEIAGICEKVGADVKDVERGLKSESRIGPGAYLSAGSGFAGGTLARDVRALMAAAERERTPHDLLSGALATNEKQQRWVDRTLHDELGDLRGRRVAILGLTYKPGTDTLRRSESVALAQRLRRLGATVIAYDPVVRTLPAHLVDVINLAPSIDAALVEADAVVVGTAWPEFTSLVPERLAPMNTRVILDPARFLEEPFRCDSGARYRGVGTPAQPMTAVSPKSAAP